MSEQVETLRPSAAALSPDELDRREFRQGQKDIAGALPGIFAWSLVTAMAMVKTGLTTSQALGMTLIVYAGSAQLAALPLIAAGAPVMVVFATALVVNVRFVIFAAGTGPHFAHLPWWRRMIFGYINGDLIMATFPRRFPHSTVNDRRGKVGYFTGCSYTNWWTWQIGAVLGILLAGQIPESWNIGYAGNLALLGMMIPLLTNMPGVAGVVVASALALIFHAWPYKLGMLSGVVAGVLVAVALESWQVRRRKAGDGQ
jgi:predicted branched-subunit amino acid permease